MKPQSIASLCYCAVYSPPNNNNAYLVTYHLLETIDKITTSFPDAGVVIAGDMNRLDLSQHTMTICSGIVDGPTKGSAILEKIITCINISL